jgi:putative ABC transport system permease protein
MHSPASPRWRKIVRDLWLGRWRALLVVLAIALGVFGLGTVLTAFSVLTREINTNYLGTRPASATIWTGPIDARLVRETRALPEVADAEVRGTIPSRVVVGPDDWRPMSLFVIPDFNDLRMSTFHREQGAWPPPDGTILIERSALPVIRTAMGDTVVVRPAGGRRQELTVAGVVHNPGLPPGWMEGAGYGYITSRTAELMGQSAVPSEIKVLVTGDSNDEAHVRRCLARITDWFEARGLQVSRIDIPSPGEHPHNDQMFTMMSLLAAFGLLALLLSGILVANLIEAVLAREIRQIGVMKALGARTIQVTGLYLAMVSMLGLAALAIGTPPSVWAGLAFVRYAIGIFNFDIVSSSVPWWVYASQTLVGLLVPLIAAAWPVWRGSRISVRDAITDHGVAADDRGSTFIARALARTDRLARPLVLGLRNTFRRRSRLVLTLITLASSGTVFMVAMHVSASWKNTIDTAFALRQFDIDVRLARPLPIDELEREIRQLAGVERVESWAFAQATHACAGAANGTRFALLAPPEPSEAMDHTVTAGRFLQPGDRNAIVVTPRLLDRMAGIQVGDSLVLEVEGRETTWRIVGVVKAIGSPVAYVSRSDLWALTGRTGTAAILRVTASSRDEQAQIALSRSIERALEQAGAGVETLVRTSVYRKAVEDHVDITLVLLLLMAILVVVVGGLSLASTMSISVMERTREIGVLRAVGASSRSILGIVLTEGVAVGILSWLIALLPAVPLSIVVGDISGQILLRAPLDFAFSSAGATLWLAVVVTLSAAASLVPAFNAARLRVGKALSYD